MGCWRRDDRNEMQETGCSTKASGKLWGGENMAVWGRGHPTAPWPPSPSARIPSRRAPHSHPGFKAERGTEHSTYLHRVHRPSTEVPTKSLRSLEEKHWALIWHRGRQDGGPDKLWGSAGAGQMGTAIYRKDEAEFIINLLRI